MNGSKLQKSPGKFQTKEELFFSTPSKQQQRLRQHLAKKRRERLLYKYNLDALRIDEDADISGLSASIRKWIKKLDGEINDLERQLGVHRSAVIIKRGKFQIVRELVA